MVGAPDPVLGEIGVAFVVPAPGRRPDPRPAAGRRCGDLARSTLADYKAPDRLVVVDSLPLTSMMKVDKRALADRAAGCAPACARPVSHDRSRPLTDDNLTNGARAP